MSESCRESRPLLRDNITDEGAVDFNEHQWQYRSPTYRSRARCNVRGAAAIIQRWPAYWSSAFLYWWMGLGMVAITVLLIYNSLIVFTMLPQAHMKRHSHHDNQANIANQSAENKTLPDVFMHFFVNTDEELDLKQYLPYIELLAHSYPDYKFLIIVVFNDTGDINTYENAKEINQLALNNLWSDQNNDYNYNRKFKNMIMKHTSLSKSLDNPLIKRDWRSLNHQYLEFMIRVLAVWEKGGIAFDPEFLTPRTSHTIYAEKIRKILKKYINKSSKNLLSRKPIRNLNKKTVNNIKDIIEALENNSTYTDYNQNNLTEMELRNVEQVTQVDNTLLLGLKNVRNNERNATVNKYTIKDNGVHNKLGKREVESDYIYEVKDITKKSSEQLKTVRNYGLLSGLPSFLNLIFNEGLKSYDSYNYTNIGDNSKLHDNSTKQMIEPSEKVKYEPTHVIQRKEKKWKEIKKHQNRTNRKKWDDSGDLTIDLKGKLLATKSQCHAFIGYVLGDVIKYWNNQTLTDFIIQELSIFCNGLLSSCVGIDLVLV